MNVRLLFLSLIMISFSAAAQSQDNRFRKPHDVDPQGVYGTPPAPVLAYNNAEESLVFININITNQTAPQNEPSVKISRKNPNRVVTAYRDFRLGIDPNAVRRVGYSYSTDGGTTWSVSTLIDSTLLGGGLLRNSDPAVAVDTAGNFYISVISLNNSNNFATVGLYKSTDGGVTFPIAVIVSQSGMLGEDKEYITADLTAGSPYKNTLYISWTRFGGFSTGIKLARSTNGGLNWSAPVNVSDETFAQQGSDPCVSTNGQVNVIWYTGDGNTNSIIYDRSTDGGNTFGTDVTIASGPAPNNLPNQVQTFPSIAADISGGPRNGYIYGVFCDARNNDADVFFCRSTTNGTSWSPPFRVNNDSIGNGKLQYWPWIAVNDQGVISIIFMDTRNTQNNTIVEAWLARSSDGGAAFTNELLSTQPSPTAIPGGGVRFGDYIGVDYLGNRVVPVWTDERAGGFDMEIYTAIVDQPLGINPGVNGIPHRFELRQNYPNPFNPVTTIWFSLPRASNVTLSIYNSLGQLLETPINESLGRGNFSFRWDAGKYSSGVYFYKLITSDGFTDTKKMVLVK